MPQGVKIHSLLEVDFETLRLFSSSVALKYKLLTRKFCYSKKSQYFCTAILQRKHYQFYPV